MSNTAGNFSVHPNQNRLYEGMTPLFWKSFAFHLILLGFLISPWNLFLWDKKIDLEKSLRVDLVALPDILAKDQQQVPKTGTIPKSRTKSLKRQRQQDDKAFRKFLQKRQKNRADLSKNESDQLVRGNILSLGTHLKGIDKIKYNRYLDKIDLSVKQKFLIPEWLRNKDLRAQVEIKINPAGRVVDKKIIQSSGNEVYDRLVLRVVDEASPFPPPPYRFKQILLLQGLILGFPE